jgi:hypothetical protein
VESNKRNKPGCFSDRCSFVDVDIVNGILFDTFMNLSVEEKGVGVVHDSLSSSVRSTVSKVSGGIVGKDIGLLLFVVTDF